MEGDREEQNPSKPKVETGDCEGSRWPGGCYRIVLNQDPDPQTWGVVSNYLEAHDNSAWNLGLVSSGQVSSSPLVKSQLL
jgi:hypothetical protein